MAWDGGVGNEASGGYLAITMKFLLYILDFHGKLVI